MTPLFRALTACSLALVLIAGCAKSPKLQASPPANVLDAASLDQNARVPASQIEDAGLVPERAAPMGDDVGYQAAVDLGLGGEYNEVEIESTSPQRPKKRKRSPQNLQDLMRNATRTEPAQLGEFCAGFSAIPCADGLFCEIPRNLINASDAGGVCRRPPPGYVPRQR